MTSRPPFESLPPLPPIPELESEFELIRTLGAGGSSVVYLGRERSSGSSLAIKLVHPSLRGDDDALARLIREARTLARVRHPAIVNLVGTRRLAGNHLAVILEYLPGRTLRERLIQSGPLTFRHTRRLLEDLGAALHYLHRKGIVHRDVKPGNVYLNEADGGARLADFGIARHSDADAGLALSLATHGTPAYMSPEQAAGGGIDGRSDLYSLGLVGYEMLSGRSPMGEAAGRGLIRKQLNELPPLTRLRPGIPPGLVRAIQGTLAENPAERWPDASIFLDALADDTPLDAEEARDDWNSPVEPVIRWEPEFEEFPTIRYQPEKPIAEAPSTTPRTAAPTHRMPARMPPPRPTPPATRPERRSAAGDTGAHPAHSPRPSGSRRPSGIRIGVLAAIGLLLLLVLLHLTGR